MIPVKLGSKRRGNKPTAGDWNTGNPNRGIRHLLFPPIEVNRTGIRRQHHKLGKCNFRLRGSHGGRVECFWAVAGQSKDERAEHIHTMAAERSELFDQVSAGRVELLVDVLQTFRSYR